MFEYCPRRKVLSTEYSISSVKIDIDSVLQEHHRLVAEEADATLRVKDRTEQLLHDSTYNAANINLVQSQKKRKLAEVGATSSSASIKPNQEQYPCILCPGMSTEGLVQIKDVPGHIVGRSREPGKKWYAHDVCALYVPEVSFIVEFIRTVC